jgi:cell migration-inducing and hyaluronan-binding protein
MSMRMPRRDYWSSLLLIALTFLFLGALMPIAAFAAITCDGVDLPAGSATTDLEVTGNCVVGAGTYIFQNVNIYKKPGATNGGTLSFQDADIDFFVESIVIENEGSMIAGSSTAPIGNNGVVTIHLWGSPGAPGATCKTDDQCGVPLTTWESNPAPSMTNPVLNPPSCKLPLLPLPGGVTNDCFYPYDVLDEADMMAGRKAYFGHKVLALSYGGTLQLFGKKGAIYPNNNISACTDTDPSVQPSCTGTSWLRLNGSLKSGATSLTVNGAVDWQNGDHIVVTTTDYLPGHSEELFIGDTPVVSGTTTTINFTNADGVTSGVKWPHNGQVYDYSTIVPARLGLPPPLTAETRAAVALLTRSIRIVSEGDEPVANSFTPNPPDPDNYFGGHTIVRQGFASYQVQGVEFYQLGQGGAMMHYPVHFHLARSTPQPAAGTPPLPAVTFVKDCSIHDSMTRWITLHGTQGVMLARNVGYLSIGHGFYLEDGTETNNKLYANIGIFARAAVANVQNPRQVPGILTHDSTDKGAQGFDNFPYYSDSNHPSVFWITNGQNDFEYNQASGAGTCGACYWFVPAAISGASRTEHWFRYAGEQEGANRAGITPLQTFLGNSCSSAMNAFTVNSDTAACNGVNFQANPPQQNTTLVMLPSENATKNYPPGAADLYWPIVTGGHKPTRCPAADQQPANPNAECAAAKICSNGDESGCDVTTLDQFTTFFNWAQQNFAAIWLRPLWALVVNSVVSDVQNGGINFVTSGDFSKASVINGFWALARKTVFIGSTQTDNPLASNAGPFNPFVSSDGTVKGLACASDPNNPVYNALYCLSQDEGVSIQLSNFSDFQRFFSVYDGPAYQDSNAYLNIHPTYLTSDGTVTGNVLNGCQPSTINGNPCVNSGFMNGGLAGLRADQLNQKCYLPNAGIGWKQPNGFYYSPAFHSTNLFFNDVDIRHFVTEPLFDPGTFDTDVSALQMQYCYWAPTAQPGTFTGFTDIDRETVLNDDDGTLTGLTSSLNSPVPPATSETISVNKEPFFSAPVCTTECASDLPLNSTAAATLAPNTADTSPYEYVTTSIFPECALSVPDSGAPIRFCAGENWGSGCTTSDPTQLNYCVGVPLYRQWLSNGEPVGFAQQKRMMGQDTFQRSGLTVNHGNYYVDTTVSKATQGTGHVASTFSPNAFVGGEKYDMFFLYANAATAQTYTMYVGPNQPPDFKDTHVKFGYVDVTTAKYTFKQNADGALPAGWTTQYDQVNGWLTLTIDMASLADDFDLTQIVDSKTGETLGQQLCQPATMCAWQKPAAGGTPAPRDNQCQCNITDPANYLYEACHELNAAGNDAICSWSTKALDCPAQGCPGLQITFPDNFKADDAADHHRPPTSLFSFDSNYQNDWGVPFVLQTADVAGQQCLYTGAPGPCPIPTP